MPRCRCTTARSTSTISICDGRPWQVNAPPTSGSAAACYDLKPLRVKNSVGEMVPLSRRFPLDPRRGPGPVMVQRYNLYPAAAITAEPCARTSAPGRRSGSFEKTAERWSCLPR